VSWRTVLGTSLAVGCFAACSPAPLTAKLDQKESAAIASAMKALVQLPAFAQNPESAPGFCLGLSEAGQERPMDPGVELLASIDSRAVPLFEYSECEPRPTPGWGDVRHLPSGKLVGLVVLGPIQWTPDGAAQVTLRVDGGPFAAAGFTCTATPTGQCECQMSWIS